jgi:hypothetical protein
MPLRQAERWSQEDLFFGVVHLSNPIDDSQKVAIHRPREIRVVKGHTRTEREVCVAC